MENKEAYLSGAHIAPLTELVEGWRQDLPDGHRIPYFDPCDAGAEARILFLMEKPGPGRDKRGVEFVSMDNEDPTARNIKRLMHDAGVERSQVLLWNAIAVWDGNRRIPKQQILGALERLPELLEKLPRLKVIVCVGLKAKRLLDRTPEGPLGRFRRFNSYHPSNQVRNRFPEHYALIPGIWRAAYEEARVGADASNETSPLRQLRVNR